MDLTQQKLVKSEWEFLEVPVDVNEKNILNELEKLNRLNKSLSNDKDYFTYLHKELDDANLISGEQEKIESKLKLAKNSEQIKLFVSQIDLDTEYRMMCEMCLIDLETVVEVPKIVIQQKRGTLRYRSFLIRT